LALFRVGVLIPVPVIVTCAFTVAVDAPGAYCTMIVQLPPGATTVPLAHVPPVMLNAGFAGTGTIAGAAVRVRFPFAVAELLTVIVAVSVAVLGVVGASVGVGAEMVTAAPCTVNATVLVFPMAVVERPTFLTPVVAVAAIARLAVTSVELTTVRLLVTRVTPAERPVTPLTPLRLVPVNVTGTVVFKNPEVGAIAVNAGPVTVNGRALLAAALPVTVTVTLCGAVVEAVVAIVKVAVADVALSTVKPLTVMPPFVTAIVV